MPEKTLTLSKRSGALDLLRFFAVLYVYFGHYTDTFNFIYQIVPQNLIYLPVSKYASTALSIFFMVSGYVVTMTSVKRNLKDFIVTRLSRIYPLFWVSCLVAYLLPKIIQTHSYLGNYSLKTFLMNLTMMPIAFGYPNLNPVFYTLSTELSFYILIALIIEFKLWNHILVIIGILIGLCIANLLFLDLSVYLFVVPFIAGMIFYFISANIIDRWKLYVLLIINFCCSLVGSGPSATQLDNIYHTPGSHQPVIIGAITTFTYAVFLLISLKKIDIKGNRTYQFLGEIAYPFYLFHIYFLCFYWYFRDSIQSDLLLYGILMITIFVSWLINIWIEKPLSKLTNKALTLFTDLFMKKKSLHPLRAND